MIKTRFFNIAKIKKQFVSAALLALCAACFVGTFASCEKSDGKTGGEQKTGEFYSLREAYDNGFITLYDLKNIAYYQNGVNNYEDFTPYDIGKLDDETALAIRTDYLSNDTELTLDDILIRKYYGTYNDYVAVMIDAYDVTQAERDVTVGGVMLHYNDGNNILIWKEIN